MVNAETILFFSGVVSLAGLLISIFVFLVFLFSFFAKKKKLNPGFKPPVSIIVPAFNSESTVKECLDSIFKSNYKNVEIIVVDDGSTDNTTKIVKKIKGVKLVSIKHAGKVAALNEGLKQVSFDLVFVLDSDTFLEENFFENAVSFFEDKKTGAVCGMVKVAEENNALNVFQQVEYLYNHLIMKSFSEVFKSSVWFFGGVSIYRKNVLKKIGGFKDKSLSEDLLTALEIKNAGYYVLHANKAVVRTVVPNTFKGLYLQRKRWWIGSMQSILAAKRVLLKRKNPATLFLFVNQTWWYLHSIVFFPLLFFLINYWFPQNDIFEAGFYLFRWFSMLGPFYYLYKLPEWGISFAGIFGVLSGVLSSAMLLLSIAIFHEKPTIQKITAVFFYFPYNILMNFFILLSLFSAIYAKIRGKKIQWETA